jgi:hypothetical protein
MPEQTEILRFLEQLSIAELRVVMDSPFEPVVMELLEKSDVLAQRVATVLEEEHQSLAIEGELPDAQGVRVQAKEIVQRLNERLSAASPDEQEMLRNLMQQLEDSVKARQSGPSVEDRLRAALGVFHINQERIRRWVELAISNAPVFAQGLGGFGFAAAEFSYSQEEQISGSFSDDKITIQLDKRDPMEVFVVEVQSTNQADCGRDLEVVLVGGTGGQKSVTVQLDKKKGDLCFGVGAIPDPEKLIAELGPYIVPIVKDG